MKTINVGEVAVFDHVEPSKEQALKPLEEAAEVFGAWQKWNETKNLEDATRIFEEIADTVQACVNLASAMGASDLIYAMRKCEKRNIKRGRITEKQALDADGVPIKVGDKLYFVGRRATELKCIGFSNDGFVKITHWESYGGWDPYITRAAANDLTHRKPDSWEQLEADAVKRGKEYWGCKGVAFCVKCEHGSHQTGKVCWQNKEIDIIRRAKALAGVDYE